MEPLFTGRDLELIESLTYDESLEPGFDYIKGCLIWTDERASGLTPDGYEALCDLWGARSFIHRGREFSSWSIAPHHFKDIWDRALHQNFKWPGFNRIELKPAERQYLQEMLERKEY